ncbi:MAG: DUF4350 domain-containing protein [Nostocoides sp.]
MTATETSAALPAVDDGATRRLRAGLRWLLVLAVGVGLLGAAVLIHPAAKGALDPENPKRAGARAVAEVLRAHGVDIDIRRSIGSFTGATVDGSSTVVIVNPDGLSPDNARRAIDHARFAHRTVLVAPSSATLTAMGIRASATVYWSTTPVRADCTTDVVRSDVAVQRGVHAYRPTNGSSWTACFTELAPKGAAPLLTSTDAAGRETVLVGYDDFLSNERVASDDFAALAIRALGASPHLLWYVPGAGDLADAVAAKPGGILFPPWFRPLVWVLGSAVVLLALVRGRRLGRVVPEPLPVVVRAVETTENLGRLYRRAGDRDRTAALLRAGTTARLAHRFGIRPSSSPATLTEAISRATGRPTHEVNALLHIPVGQDDRSLLDLAQQLSDLEEQVHTP